MTLDITWDHAQLPTLPGSPDRKEVVPIDLELSAGRVLDAVAWPSSTDGYPWESASGLWRLGNAARGHARVRVEAPLSATVILVVGSHRTAFPLAKLLEEPQQSHQSAPAALNVARLPWDALEVDLRDPDNDGRVEPGSRVPLTISYNIITPEPAEAIVHLDATLRRIGSDVPLNRWQQSHVVATDYARPPVIQVEIAMPQETGTYVLDMQANWEPVVALEGSRIGRLIRRRRTGQWPGPTSARRRVTLLVAAASPVAPEAADEATEPSVVEQIELGRGWGIWSTASGRSPLAENGSWPIPTAATVQASLRDRLRGWILGSAEAALLAPETGDGLAWTAVGLHVAQPGKAHRLSVTVQEGDPRNLAVGLIDPGDGERSPRIVLDAMGHAPPPAEGKPAACSWLAWPGVKEPVLVLFNRSGTEPLRLSSVQLEELPELSSAEAADAAAVPSNASRALGLLLAGTGDLDRFRGVEEPNLSDPASLATNLLRFARASGTRLVVLPEQLADRTRRRALEGQAGEDCTGPDHLATILDALASTPIRAWIELPGEGPLPGLPPAVEPAAAEAGLVRLNAEGKVVEPVYHALVPAVQDAFQQRIRDALAPHSKREALDGVVIRMGAGATLLGPPDTGLDDATYARFALEMFDAATRQTVPGQSDSDPARFQKRAEFLSRTGTRPWQIWRSRELGRVYQQLARSVRDIEPDLILAAVTPIWDERFTASVFRQADLLNQSPVTTWKTLGLDLELWPREESNLVLLRGATVASTPLERDLNTHPELDALVRDWPVRGVIQYPPRPAPDSNSALRARPPLSGGSDDELTGHAMACLDARWVILGAPVTAGREAALQRFATVLGPLPPESLPADQPLSAETGASLRSWSSGEQTWLGLANDTPYTLRVETILRGLSEDAQVEDLGRGWKLNPQAVSGGRHLVLDLPPFGVTTLALNRPGVRADAVALHALDDIDAQMQSLTSLLDQLGESRAVGPSNGGFEPERAGSPVTQPTAFNTAEAPRGVISGWVATGAAENRLVLDLERPHTGQGSLRLDASGLPTSAAGPTFLPPGGQEWLISAWMMADAPNTKVRLWIEGKAGDRSVNQVALLEVPNRWTERMVRVAHLPVPGLSEVRLRFEPLAPGSVWIDDLSVVGEAEPDLQRRAQLVLTMAIQAHRERRLADFARLASSRWVNTPGLYGEPGTHQIQTGDSTGLSPGSRLR